MIAVGKKTRGEVLDFGCDVQVQNMSVIVVNNNESEKILHKYNIY